MNELEKRIKEQRTVEANKKNLMGFDGKLGCIVRNMGQPIVGQTRGGCYYSEGPSYDFWAIPGDEEELHGTPEEITQQIPTFDTEGGEQPEGDVWMERHSPVVFESVENLGWYFDGLSRGMHLEIKYDENEKELLVRYKGRVVYQETAGDLESYVPMHEWEDMIDRLAKVAKQLQITKNKKEKEENKKQIKAHKESWVTKMKNKWGF